jgi:hypothetical protein
MYEENEILENSGLLAFLMGYLAFFLILGIIIIIARWKIFQKAGKPGWAAIVPIYNFIVELEIIGKPWWWLLLMFIPIVNIVFAIMIVNLLAKSFGKDVGFTLGLLFLPFIFYPILGFGKAEYVGPVGDPAALEAYRNSKYNFGEGN